MPRFLFLFYISDEFTMTIDVMKKYLLFKSSMLKFKCCISDAKEPLSFCDLPRILPSKSCVTIQSCMHLPCKSD